MRGISAFPILLVLLLFAQAGIFEAQQDSEAKIKDALSAAPAAIAKGAAVADWDDTLLREGSNGWTCLPSPPDHPGEGPMCLDGQWVKWAEAWMGKTKPGLSRVGLAYMLKGGKDASNTDPYATEPGPGEGWIDSGPHVMIIVPDPALLEGLPTDHRSGGPYVMWEGTPYAHIMMPVGKR